MLLLDLPHDILLTIIHELNALDLSRLSAVCKALDSLVSHAQFHVGQVLT